MKTTLLVGALSTLLGHVAGIKLETIHNPPVNELFRSGQVHMSLIGAKESTFERQLQAGAYNSSQYPSVRRFTPCIRGKAAGYSCSNMDLYAFAPHTELGSETGEGSSSWGWTSRDGREIMVVGQVSPLKESNEIKPLRAASG